MSELVRSLRYQPVTVDHVHVGYYKVWWRAVQAFGPGWIHLIRKRETAEQMIKMDFWRLCGFVFRYLGKKKLRQGSSHNFVGVIIFTVWPEPDFPDFSKKTKIGAAGDAGSPFLRIKANPG